MTTEMKHFELDPAGTLTLVVGKAGDAVIVTPESQPLQTVGTKGAPAMAGCTILVSRPHMAMASPVWKAMLSSGWKESTSNRVELPEDHPEALLLLLRIAHSQFQDVPTELHVTALHQLAVMCDKYDCVQLTRPWLKHWILAYQILRKYETGYAFICWTFGLEAAFRHIMRTLIYETRLNHHTKMPTASTSCSPFKTRWVTIERLIYEGRNLKNEVFPPGMLGRSLTLCVDQLDIVC